MPSRNDDSQRHSNHRGRTHRRQVGGVPQTSGYGERLDAHREHYRTKSECAEINAAINASKHGTGAYRKPQFGQKRMITTTIEAITKHELRAESETEALRAFTSRHHGAIVRSINGRTVTGKCEQCHGFLFAGAAHTCAKEGR